MMIDKNEITGIILAGGRSSRFGSNKALYKVGTTTMLQKSVELLQPNCSEIFISGDCPEYAAYPVKCISDIIKDIGPLGGIWSTLKSINTPYALYLTCDMPYLTNHILLQLMQMDKSTQMACWKDSNGNMQLFPLLLSRELLPAIEKKIVAQSYNIRSLAEHCKHQFLPIPYQDEICFHNINRLKDIAV